MRLYLLVLIACGTSEVTAPETETVNADSNADADTDVDSDTDSDSDSDTEPASTVDPNPNENGNVMIELQLGRSVSSIEFWYGYCATREAVDCPEFDYVGEEANTRTYDFEFVGTTGSLKFDAYIDEDGDGVIDSDLADLDGSGYCYTTAEVAAFMDGESVTTLLSSVTTDNCLIGLSLTDAWDSVSTSP